MKSCAAFQDAQTRRGLIGPLGQVGAAGDNAGTESFVALVQKNELDRGRWATWVEWRAGIITWIERSYHRWERQGSLARLTPIAFELIWDYTPAHAA